MITFGITVTIFKQLPWDKKHIRVLEKGYTNAQKALSDAGKLFLKPYIKAVHVHPENGEQAGETVLWLNKNEEGKVIKREYNPI